jgi:hypothetical protein
VLDLALGYLKHLLVVIHHKQYIELANNAPATLIAIRYEPAVAALLATVTVDTIVSVAAGTVYSVVGVLLLGLALSQAPYRLLPLFIFSLVLVV